MPEGYTHVRTGINALHKSDIKKTTSLLAFATGTNGPDPLFFREIWKKTETRKYNLPYLAEKLHREKTGKFLLSLIKNSSTPVKKAYSLGFLTHYATDCTIHPYIKYITTSENAPYQMNHGHGFFETALDSYLHLQDFGNPCVHALHSTPLPSIEELKEIAELLSKCLLEIYSIDIPEIEIIKSFKNMYTIRSILKSKFGFKKWIFFLIDNFVVKNQNFILSHVTPTSKIKIPIGDWTNPYNNIINSKNCFDLLEDAENLSSELINNAYNFWNNKINDSIFLKILGSFNYETGLQDSLSLGKERK